MAGFTPSSEDLVQKIPVQAMIRIVMNNLDSLDRPEPIELPSIPVRLLMLVFPSLRKCLFSQVTLNQNFDVRRNQYEEWSPLWLQYEDGDEFWEYAWCPKFKSRPGGRVLLAARFGYALVRNGQPIAGVVTGMS